MATTTHAAQSYSGRKFSISRKNGVTDKNGEPYFFEYIQDIPADPGKRLFEVRGKRKFELFKAVSGKLVGIAIEEQTFGPDKVEKHVVVYLQDGPEDYKVVLGKPEDRYASDFMKRILHKDFDSNAVLSLSPFAATEGDKVNMGVSVYSGANKLTAKKDDPHLQGIAQPQTFVNPKTEKTEYNWKPVAAWLWLQVRDFVLPKLQSDPISVPAAKLPAPQVAPALDHSFPSEEPAVMPESDDLPF